MLLIGLAWTVPFLQPYHRYPLTGFYSEWIAFALGLAAALPLLRSGSWAGAKLPVIALGPLALILVLALQTALDRVPYPEQAITATLYLLWAAMLILLGRLLANDTGMTACADALAWFLLISGILNVSIALLQHFQVSTPLDYLVVHKSSGQGYGNLGQSNHFCVYLSMSLASAMYLHGRARLALAWAMTWVILFLLVLAFAGSRSTWLYFLAFAFLAAILHRAQRDAVSERLVLLSCWLIPGFILANVFAMLPFMAPDMPTSARRLFQLAGGVQPRLELWREAWEVFLGHPFLGAGWGQFSWGHFLHQAQAGPGLTPGVFNHSHNIVMQLMAETGLAGTVVFGAVAAYWLSSQRSTRIDPVRWWIYCLLAVIAIHSLLEFPLWYAYFLGMAAILLGLSTEGGIALRFTGAARAIAGIALLVGFVNLAAVVKPYRDFERLVFSPGAPSHAVNEKLFGQAIVEIRREPFLTPYVELAVAYGATITKEWLREKLELTARAMRFAPTSVVVYRHAMLLALAGEREAALRQLERAARAYPRELAEFLVEVSLLARRDPGTFGPLLEWAASRLAEDRASPVIK